MEKNKTYRVIIRNRNEEQYIGFAIQSVIDHLPKDTKITIVDNESNDDSLGIVNLFSDRIDIDILNIESKEYSPGKAINLAVKKSKEEIILVLSAHCQIVRLGLHSLENKLFQDDFEAVFGNQEPIYKGKKITKRYIWSHFSDHTPKMNMYSDIERRYFLHNGFCFYKTKYLKKYPMPEIYPGKEDRYWAADLRERGHDYFYDNNLIANHFYTEGGATWKGLA